MTTRPLTAGEIKLAQTIFGTAIDYASVRVHDTKFIFFQPGNTAMSPNGNLYMHNLYSADYAQCDADAQALFIHEMAHVWQFQNKVLHPVTAAAALTLEHRFNYFAAYAFRLDENKDLIHYGMEQQAAIIQGYFLLKQAGCAFRHCDNACDDAEKLRLYERVLEKFLKNPAYAKQAQFPGRAKRPKP